jgi:hypothetical protein
VASHESSGAAAGWVGLGEGAMAALWQDRSLCAPTRG